MKKTASLLLTVAMLVTMLCFPIEISAETYDIPSNAIAITSANVKSVIAENGIDNTYYLAENITIQAPIAESFSGKLYGGGKTVTANSPLFLELNGAVVSDIFIASSITIDTDNVGEDVDLFAGTLANTASNVQINNVDVSGTLTFKSFPRRHYITNISFGGLIGCVASGSLTDCDNSCVVIYNDEIAGSIGGLVGSVIATEGSFSATNCLNNAAIGNSDSPVSGIITGGIVAFANAPSLSFTNCANKGVINGNTANAGGIVGKSIKLSSTIQMTFCTNTANITTVTDSTASTSGGMIGYSDSAMTFTNCSNSGNITSSARTAGIVGWAAASSTFTSCTNSGKLESTNTTSYHGYVGGIAGYVSAGEFKFEYCENSGKLLSNQTAAGILGYNAAPSGTTITYSVNKGNVTANGGYTGTSKTALSIAAGIVGRSIQPLTVKYCGSSGDVTNNSTATSNVGGMTASGIVGYATVAPTVKDNYFIGHVSAKSSAYSTAVSAVSTVAVSSISNNYYLYTTNYDYIASGVSSPVSLNLKITDEDISGGKLAYLLQQATGKTETLWGQDLSGSVVDTEPKLFGTKVLYDSIDDTYYNEGVLAYSSVNLTSSFTLYAYVYSDTDITDSYTAVFTMAGKDTSVKCKLYKAEQNLYRFGFEKIAPQYIGETITITLYNGDKVVDTAETNIVKYCEALFYMNNYNLRQLAADIVAYGHAAREYVIANNLTDSADIAVINSPALSAASINNTNKNIPSLNFSSTIVNSALPTIDSATVRFNSTNRLYFNVNVPEGCDPADWQLTVGGKSYPLGTKNANGKYSVITDEIYARNFVNDSVIALTNGTVNHTITYSVAIYAARMSQNSSSATMRALAAATYWYGASAKDYIANPNISHTLSGKDLSSFSIVANTITDSSAYDIADFISDNYGIELPIITPSSFKGGNAILIDQGNTYGNVRYGIDIDTTATGDVHIYIDGVGSYTDDMTDKFIELLPAAIDRKLNIEDDFYYNYPSNIRNNGYLLNTATDVTRTLAEGVTYIERTYTTAKIKSGTATTSPAGVKNTMYILILEADAKAHFEVYNAPFKNVSSCTHEVDCSLVHVTPDTAANLAADLESEGKNILAATNASYFMLSNKCYTPWGMQIVNGKVNIEPHIVSSSSNRGRTWFGVTKDGTPVISDISGYNNTYKGNIQNGIGGHTKLLINSNIFTAQSSEGDALVAIGYNAKGDIVIVVSDGDNKNPTKHPGATSADLAQLFMDLDMDIIAALQLDGGGSTAILVEDANGDLKRENTVNSDSSGVSRLENRTIADIIAIVAD